MVQHGLLVAVAPPLLPPFWERFVTEILIWGLLAMSSDILIGYTGMVSFGHSAFLGLGMYGTAAALLLKAGQEKMKQVDPVPTQTVETLKENVEWATSRSD